MVFRTLVKRAAWTGRDRRAASAVAVLIIASLAAATAATGPEREGEIERNDRARAPYAVGLWGDLPYSAAQAETGVPNLIPRRQTVSGCARSAARELHARRDLRRQPGERKQRRALAEGGRRSEEPGGVLVSATDCAREQNGRADSLSDVRRRGEGGFCGLRHAVRLRPAVDAARAAGHDLWQETAVRCQKFTSAWSANRRCVGCLTGKFVNRRTSASSRRAVAAPPWCGNQ